VSHREESKQGLRAGDLRALLDRLGAEPQESAERYEQLRRKMINYFLWEQCENAEDLADECLDRVARKLEDGVEIQSPSGYMAGVARIMVKENRSRRQREQAVMEEFSNRIAHTGEAEDIEQAVRDLEECLKNFSPSQRSLLLRYYEGDHAQRILIRARLAEELNILPNALRNRAMRLRTLLETCMTTRIARRDGSAANPTISRSAGQ
jgi:DNA-directed RNA polymerase specialized sigma24 family protein